MATVETLRNNIIDKLLTISNKDYLLALNNLVERNPSYDNPVILNNAQISMLELSDTDILNGNLISQDELDKSDLQWLREQ